MVDAGLEGGLRWGVESDVACGIDSGLFASLVGWMRRLEGPGGVKGREERLVEIDGLRSEYCSKRSFDGSRFRRASWLQGFGPGSGSCAKVQPLEIPAIHVPPRSLPTHQ